MTTTKSYSKDSRFLSAYVSALKAQLPFAIVSGIIFFILFIVVFLVTTLGQLDNSEYAYKYFRDYFTQGVYTDIAQSITAYVFLAIVTIASTLMGMSYMHKKNTVDLYHSLPVTRPQLLSANLLATLTAVVGPFIIMQLLTMAVQIIACARYGCFSADYFLFTFFDIIGAIAYAAVVATFTAFIAVNVGTVFDAFSVAVITGFTPLGVYLISLAVWQSLTYGAYSEPGENILYLSPFLFIYKRYFYFDKYLVATADYIGNAWVTLIGIVLAAVFFILAAVFYRRRKSEIAEQTQPRGVLQIIVRLVSAFAGGAMFFAIFSDAGFAARVIATFFGAVVIGLVSELILSRGVKWLGKNIKLLVGAGLAYCLLLIFIQADTFGYVSRLPAPDSISGVRISYDGHFSESDNRSYSYSLDADGKDWLTGPESAAIVRDAHSAIINNKPEDKTRSYGDDEFDYSTLRMEYKLKNGTTMKRTYSPVNMLAYQKLAELEANDDFIRANSTLFWMKENPDKAKVETVELYPSFGKTSGQHANVLENPEILMDAIRADMLDQSLEDILHPKEPSLGTIIVNFKQAIVSDGFDEDGKYKNYRSSSAAVVVTREYKRTIDVLKRLNLNGGFDDGPLNIDDVVRAGLNPASKSSSYELKRVRTFARSSDSSSAPSSFRQKTGVDYHQLLDITDKETIKSIAQASRDTLFVESEQDWNENYAIAYFEMSDGSTTTKAVRLNELPPDISSRVSSLDKNRQ